MEVTREQGEGELMKLFPLLSTRLGERAELNNFLDRQHPFSGQPDRCTDEPKLLISCDVDWASEAIIDDMCGSLIEDRVRPLLFSTHRSEVMLRLQREARIDIGLHPNFFPGSDQGGSYEEVLDYLLSIHPQASISRSHSYFDNSRVAALLAAKGIRYDSNVCYFLQPSITPIRMWNGMIRLPVFWEDDVHWTTGRRLLFDDEMRRAFTTPGLKIVDVHPINYAFNVSSDEQYRLIRSLTTTAETADIRAHRLPGPGVRDFVEALLDFTRRESIPILPMAQLLDCAGEE